jgi:predicted RNase H-like HicB family nuclease
MMYPVYVHKDPETAYGVTFPDFPGCFSAADELEGLPRLAQEAVEVHFEGEDGEIPPPTAIEELAAPDQYEGGFWFLIDIDLTKVNTKSVRLNISERVSKGTTATPTSPGIEIAWLPTLVPSGTAIRSSHVP